MKILQELETYKPYDEQEEKDINSLKQFVLAFKEFSFSRECLPGHMTTIAWVVNPERTKVLMGYHNLYKVFTWFGGHADGELDLLENAKKELSEETGILNYKILNKYQPFDYSVLHVDSHIKHNQIVSDHLHYSVAYLFEVDEHETYRIAENENSAICWIDIDNVLQHSNTKLVEQIYKRLMNKIKEFNL